MAQTLTEIRQMLDDAGLRPQKFLGQNFMVDHNLLAALVDLAGIATGELVLEVGPGTGTLTDELLAAGATVVAVEFDRGLAALLTERYAAESRFHLLHCDVLAGKHAIEPKVLATVQDLASDRAHLVSNLPYSIAVPVVCECMLEAFAADRGRTDAVRFVDMTFTVQREVADRFAAVAGTAAYGPASVLTSLLGQATLGKVLPGQAFWPRPKVASRMMRIDVGIPDAEKIPDVSVLTDLVNWAFRHRRKKISAAGRRTGSPLPPKSIAAAFESAGVDSDSRPDRISPAQYALAAAALAEREDS